MVVRTIGTAPRSPAQDRKASSRQRHVGPRGAHPTETGRATKVSTSPATIARPTVREVDPARREQQAEHHEQPDLGQPRDALGERPGGDAVGQLAVAEDQRGDVDRGEAGAVHGRRGAVREEGQAQHGDRVEAGATAARRGASGRRRRSRATSPERTPTASSHATIPAAPRRPWSTHAPVEIRVTSTTVGASLRPDSASSGPTEPRGSGTTPQHREHRGRVGRRGDRAEQHRQLPRQPEQVVGDHGHHGDRDRRRRSSPARHRAASTGRTSRHEVVRPPSARMDRERREAERVGDLRRCRTGSRPRTRRGPRPSAGRSAGWAARRATESRTARIARRVTALPTSRN